MWEAIKTRNSGADRVKEARLQTLITEFKNLKMSDNEIIDAYAAKLWGILSKSTTLREVMSEHKLDVVGRLKAREERVKEEDKANDSQENLLYARTEYSNGNNDTSRGRGRSSYSRGRGCGRGRGRGQGSGRGNTQNHGQRDSSKNREDNEQKGKQHEKCDLSHIQCYRCDQYRNFVSKCPERNRNHKVNLNETQEKDVYHEEGMFFMVNHIKETIFINEEKYTLPKSESNTDEDDVWYFDNDASNHMTGKRLDFVPSSVTVHSPVHETNPESEEDNSRSDDTPNPLVRLETIRLLIALAAGKGWKIHHLDVKTAFLNGDRKKFDSTLKDMGFLQCVHEKAMYRKRIASQFEMSDLGELTYYLDIKVSQGKDCVDIKQERYAMKILKEAGMEDCIETLCPMELGLKLSKAKDEPKFEATQYQKMVGCLRYLFHTHPHSTYSLGVVSRFMQSPRISHDHAINQILRNLKGTTSFGIKYKRGTSPITGCSQKQTIMALSSCEAEFMAATIAACQAI
ncbi:uncharacterized mitochondrial protein-like protein [Tanacetum coccineum]